MIKTLTCSSKTNPIKLPAISAGMGYGVQIKIWVCRTGTSSRMRIVELGNDAGVRLVLGTGDQPDSLVLGIENGSNRTEIVALGALPKDRWVLVTAIAKSVGAGSISVFENSVISGAIGALPDGSLTRCYVAGNDEEKFFTGNLSQLNLSFFTTSSNTPTLYSSYPLQEVYPVEDPTGTETSYRVEDVGPNKQDGSVAGALASAQFPYLAPSAVPVLELDGGNSVQVAPLMDLSGELTMEAWVCPNDASKKQVVLFLADGKGKRLILSVGGGSKSISLSVVDDDQVYTLLSAADAVRSGVFTHIAAVLKVPKAGQVLSGSGYRLELYRQGQLVASTQTIGSIYAYGVLSYLLHQSMLPACQISGQAGNGSLARFAGKLAEVRIWGDPLSAANIGLRFLRRLVGNEPGLRACYRLEEDVNGYFYDISGRRGMGRLKNGLRITTTPALPLLPTQGDVYLAVKGKLVTEAIYLKPPQVGTSVTSPAVVQATVFDALFEGRRQSSGPGLGGSTLQLIANQNVSVLTKSSDGDYFVEEVMTAGSIRTFTLPPDGKLRLRFTAKDITFPTLRARLDGSEANVWTLVRPDRTVATALLGMKASDLRAPAGGKASPLPGGATDGDAKAFADVMHVLGAACGLPLSETSSSSVGESRSLWGDIGDAWDDGREAVVNTAEVMGEELAEVGDHVASYANAVVDNGLLDLTQATSSGIKAASSVLRTVSNKTSDLGDLIKAASLAVQRYGQSEIEKCVDSAKKLAAVPGPLVDQVAQTFAIIGTSIVDGTEVVWRVVCTGAQQAFVALKAIVKKIGASIDKLIKYLAWLLNWQAFLNASDEILANLESYLADLPGLVSGLSQYKSQVAPYFTIPSGIGDQTLGQICHLSSVPQVPNLDELQYVLEVVQQLFGSSSFSLSGLDDQVTALAGQTSGLNLTAIQGGIGVQPATVVSLFSNPSELLNTPLQGLLNTLLTGSSATTIVDFLFDTLTSSVNTAIGGLTSVLKGHINVPGLTQLLEGIMGGRKLTLLRLASFVAAIPKVLINKLGGSEPSPVSFASDGVEAAAWCSFSFGLIFSILEGVRATVELASPKGATKAKRMLDVMAGLALMGRSSCGYELNKAFPQEVQDVLAVQSTVELLSGLFLMLCSSLDLALEAALSDVGGKLNCGLQAVLAVVSIIDTSVAARRGAFTTDAEWSAFGLQACAIVFAQLAAAIGLATEYTSMGQVGPIAQAGCSGLTVGCNLGIAILDAVSAS